MHYLVTSEEMGLLDSIAMDKYGISSLILMENAGRSVADIIVSNFSNEIKSGAFVLSGPGNNGGDGFVIARHLHQMGYKVMVGLTISEDKYRGDALTNLSIIKKMGIEISHYTDDEKIGHFKETVRDFAVIVDCIFGIGLQRPIGGYLFDIINIINNSGKKVLSVDVPSGICATTGRVMGIAVKADLTVTLGFEKTGLRTGSALSHVGDIICCDIGIPKVELINLKPDCYLVEGSYIRGLLKKRERDSHKGTFGHVGILAGSEGKTGAAILSSMGSLYMGAGLTTIISTPSTLKHPALPPEVMTYEINSWDIDNLHLILEVCEKFDSIVIGPGMGINEKTQVFCLEFLCKINKPIVLDADMLTNISKNTNILNDIKADKILTPHPGEMARLTGISKEEVNSNRIGISKKLAKETNSTIILKGAGTVIAQPNGRVSINSTGNPGMASGGTGDVLSGILGSLLAQGYGTKEASEIGVFIHGLSADYLSHEKGYVAITASEIAKNLPYTIKEITI